MVKDAVNVSARAPAISYQASPDVLGSDVCFTGVGAMSVKGRGRVCGMLAIFDWGTECESWEIMLQLH